MEDIIRENWDEILEYLKVEHGITDVYFRTWLQALEVYSVVDHLITIYINDSKIGDSRKYIINKFGVPLQVSIE